jgi:prepilin peptidase CpaA
MKLALTALLVACAFYDLIEFKIPNALSAAILLLFPVWVVTQRLTLFQLGDHLAVGAIVLAGTAILYRFRLLGGGDVKLLSVTCLWAGSYAFLSHLLLTSLFAVGVLVLILLARSIYHALVATVPRLYAMPVPRVLQPGAGVPYGIAITASAVALGMPQIS